MLRYRFIIGAILPSNEPAIYCLSITACNFNLLEKIGITRLIDFKKRVSNKLYETQKFRWLWKLLLYSSIIMI